MPIKIAINGFGRIGRQAFRQIIDRCRSIKVVAVNDLTDTRTLAHLLKYDSLYGIYRKSIAFTQNSISINRERFRVYSEANPEKLPWKKLGVDIVLECSGRFTDYDGAKKHLDAGAKKVIISAPCSTPEKVPSFCLGVNADKLDIKKYDIVDMASCTTNCLAVVLKVLNDNFKIKRGFLTTCHAYTNDQKILDLPHKDLRRARAAALNIIPTSTGAARAIGKVIPDLEGKMDGIALRIPVPTVSISDIVCLVEKNTSAEEVNYCFKKASFRKELSGILGVEDAPLVSSDYKGNSFSAIIDSSLTMVKDDLVKVVAWYDNEWGYASRLAEFAEYVAKKMEKMNN